MEGLLELLQAVGNDIAGCQVPKDVLEGGSPADLLNEGKFLLSLFLRHLFFGTFIGVVVVDERVETSKRGPAENILVHMREEVVICGVRPVVDSFAISHVDGVVSPRDQAIDIQVPQAAGSCGEVLELILTGLHIHASGGLGIMLLASTMFVLVTNTVWNLQAQVPE